MEFYFSNFSLLRYFIALTKNVGISLFSQAVTSQVSSAPLSLTSVFGMGTGGPSTSSTPTSYFLIISLFILLCKHFFLFFIFSLTYFFGHFLVTPATYQPNTHSLHPSLSTLGDSYGNRTRVSGVRGRCLNRLTNEPSLFPGLSRLFLGAPSGTRTRDTLIKSQVLYHLS